MPELSAPRNSTIRRLFALSMNRCAFPGCSTPILDQATNTIIGEVCHIHAKNENGPRHDPDQTPEERHGFENLILMCSVHHTVIDAPENLTRYTANRLREIKAEHEGRATEDHPALPPLTRAQLTELLAASSYIGQQVTHVDFRHSVIGAGGQGGRNGGGGGGGVVTIVGTTQTPPSAELNLDGQAPGGGGGALGFIGRSSNQDDVRSGLRISSIFTVNSFHFDHGVFHVLGGGWTCLPLDTIPSSVSVLLICIVELGAIPENTLVKFDVDVIDPTGQKVSADVFDVSAGGTLIARHIAMRRLTFEATAPGVWTFQVSSGGTLFADYDIEIKRK